MADVNKVTNLISIIKQTDQQFLDPKGIMLKDILDASGASAQELFDILNGGKEVDGSVSKAVNDAVLALVDGAPGQLDTLKEISDALAGDAASTATLLKAIADNAAASDEKHNTYAKETEDARIATAAEVEKLRAERAATLASELADYKAKVEEDQTSQDDDFSKYQEDTESNRIATAAEVEKLRAERAAALASDFEDYKVKVEEGQTSQDDAFSKYQEDTETARVATAEAVEKARVEEAARIESEKVATAAEVEKLRAERASTLASELADYKAKVEEDQISQDDKHSDLKTAHDSLDTFVRTNLDLDLDGDGAYDKLSEFLEFVNTAQAADADSIAKAIKDASDANVELEGRVNTSLDVTNAQVASNKKESDESLEQANTLITQNHTAALEATATVQQNLNTAESALNVKISDVSDSLNNYKGEQEIAANAIAKATSEYRSENDSDWDILYTARAEEAAEYSSFKKDDVSWKEDMNSRFDSEKAATKKDRAELRKSINDMVNDQNADAINSIEEIINHVTQITNSNVSDIYARDVRFTAAGSLITPEESIWEGTFSAKMNGVEVYEGDFTPTYADGRLVSFELGSSLLEMHQGGAKLAISGRVGELKEYSWKLDLPFSE
jgi:hypothetical protein